MKKLTMTVAMFITVMGAAMASGNGSKAVRANVVPASNQVYKVIYAAEETNVVKIRLRDEQGRLIRTDRVKSEGGFVMPYDMSSLEEGTYSVEVTDQFGVYTENIVIKDEQLVALKTLEDSRYQLIVDNGEKSPFHVAIFDAEGELIHQEKHSSMNGFSRIYDLSNFGGSEFTFELATDTNIQRLAIK